jgi:short subunit dehydrogenase-like uncharacterized protein
VSRVQYRFFGESVVKACLAGGTHYVDVTGETEFMERMAVTYDDSAAEKKLTLVHACGFDSVVADMGVLHAEQQFKAVHPNGVAGAVDSYLALQWGPKGMAGHATTYESFLHSLANINALRNLRKELRKKQTEKYGGTRTRADRAPAMHRTDLLPSVLVWQRWSASVRSRRLLRCRVGCRIWVVGQCRSRRVTRRLCATVSTQCMRPTSSAE